MSRARVKLDERAVARIVQADVLGKIKEIHGSPAQFALATKGVEAEDRPFLERVATDAVQGLGKTLDKALKGFDPATNTNPNITLYGHAGQEVFTPASLGSAWDPLEYTTLLDKAGGKGKLRAIENRKRAAIIMQSKRGFWFRVWRHRRFGQIGTYQKLQKVLAAMQRAKVKFVRVSKTPTRTKIAGGTVMHFQYALVFPMFSGPDGALINSLAMRFLLLDSMLAKGSDWMWADPPGWSKDIPKSDIRAVLHPERARPLIRPLAGAAGRRLDAQLRRLRK